MLSKATVKFIKSLQVKKYRKQEQCFLIEGAKSVEELLASDFEIVSVFATAEFLARRDMPMRAAVTEVREADLESLGEFRTNNSALAVARMKENRPLRLSPQEYILALDDIRDPGNLGTIIRTADWYGIRGIVASPETADFYSPKVISATMGSFTRVQVYYSDLSEFLSGCDLAIYGAFLEGANVHTVNFASGGVIVVGSESHGISPEVAAHVSAKITIPRYGQAESLNAGIATAVILDNLRRAV